MAVASEEVLGTFYGSDEFPIEWEEGEKELFWIYDDLHCPNPVSPLFFDIGGWWLTCDHMFRRFGTPFACDWIAKSINGYVYTAADPGRLLAPLRGDRVQRPLRPARAARPRPCGEDRRLPRLGPPALRARTSSTGGASGCARRSSATSPTSTAYDMENASLRRARRPARGRDRHPRPSLEDPLDAQLRPVLLHAGAQRDDRGGQGRGRPEPRRPAPELGRRTATGTRSRRSGR